MKHKTNAFKRSIVTKNSPPHDPLKYPTLASFPPLAASKDNTESDHEPKLHSEILKNLI